MTPNMIAIQIAVLDIMKACVSELKRCNSSVSLSGDGVCVYFLMLNILFCLTCVLASPGTEAMGSHSTPSQNILFFWPLQLDITSGSLLTQLAMALSPD